MKCESCGYAAGMMNLEGGLCASCREQGEEPRKGLFGTVKKAVSDHSATNRRVQDVQLLMATNYPQVLPTFQAMMGHYRIKADLYDLIGDNLDATGLELTAKVVALMEEKLREVQS